MNTAHDATLSLHLYAVRDSAASRYLPPFPALNDHVAQRMFASAVGDERHDFHKHARDYALFYVGSYSTDTGTLTQDANPRLVVHGEDLKKAILQEIASENVNQQLNN